MLKPPPQINNQVKTNSSRVRLEHELKLIGKKLGRIQLENDTFTVFRQIRSSRAFFSIKGNIKQVEDHFVINYSIKAFDLIRYLAPFSFILLLLFSFLIPDVITSMTEKLFSIENMPLFLRYSIFFALNFAAMFLFNYLIRLDMKHCDQELAKL